jgi:hypothetical protein
VVVISKVAVKEASGNQGPSVVALEEQGQVLLEQVMAASRQEMQDNTISGSTQSLNTTAMSLGSLEEKPCSSRSALTNLVSVSQAQKMCLL